MNKNDLRYVRTEENLKNALLKLLETGAIDSFTITDLCAAANCSRNAFYKHYETKYDLYNTVLNETVETIRDSCQALIKDLREVDETIMRSYSHRLLEVISSRSREIAAFLRSSRAFRETLCSSMYEEMISQDLKITGKESLGAETELLTQYMAAGITLFIEYWLLHTSLPLAEAQTLLDLCTHDNIVRKLEYLMSEPV